MLFDAKKKLSVLGAERLEVSDISVICALLAKHPGVSFSSGEPASELYPIKELQEAFVEALEEPGILDYYDSDMGYAPLREWLAALMHEDGIAPAWVTAEHILLTHGAAEAINDVTELLLDAGDIVAVEEATYVEALINFRKQGALCLGVKMDEDGIVPEALEEACGKNKIKMLYTIPNFSNPTGRTATLERRKAVLEVCRKYNVLILEDDPYRYLSYDGGVPASYLALAGDGGNVIYCSSFSKVIAPGVRMGWLAIPPALTERFSTFQICNGLIQQPFTHKAVYHYLQKNDFRTRISFLCREYGKRRDDLLAEIDSWLKPLGVHVSRPKGGFFIWGTADGIHDMMDFAKYAIEHNGVAVIPGSSFIADGVSGKNTCRFSFSKVTPEAAKEGCKRLAEAIKVYRSM